VKDFFEANRVQVPDGPGVLSWCQALFKERNAERCEFHLEAGAGIV
jgi:hypothetical protein